ncbi:hypothetical protein A6J64_019555 [Yersinia enterocolitica]|nr:hypothetical protein A6J63_020770 [Yersinia enterocolitica]PNM14018.1 hypothetical protein A6J64_019555 [Yersinia enterocolitica]
MQGVTVVLTVRVYAGERIVHVNASLYLLTTIPFVLKAAGLLAVRVHPNHLPVLTIDKFIGIYLLVAVLSTPRSLGIACG